MSNRVTDLTFLKNFTEGNQASYEKYIRLFITDSHSLMKLLRQKIDEADWPGIETAAHTLRARFSFMGAREAEELTKVIRENAASTKNMDEAKSKTAALTELFNSATKELQEELNLLKNSGIGF